MHKGADAGPWLQSRQVRIVTDPNEAQLHVKVFAPVLGVDQAQSFIGTPAFTVPFLGVTIPEIPVFRDVRHMGHGSYHGAAQSWQLRGSQSRDGSAGGFQRLSRHAGWRKAGRPSDLRAVKF